MYIDYVFEKSKQNSYFTYQIIDIIKSLSTSHKKNLFIWQSLMQQCQILHFMWYIVLLSKITATITLDDGRFLEEIVKELSDTKLKDNVVTVSFCSNDRLLCVAHMPPRYSDEEFLKFVSQHGPVKYCFLIRSETTGDNGNSIYLL